MRPRFQQKKLQKIFLNIVVPATICTVVAFLFVIVAINSANAGSLTPSSAPAANGYTLQDILNRLTTNTATTSGTHSFTPTTTPQSTFPTLIQIYNSIPTINPAKLLSDTTYLGITGTYNADNLIVSNVKSGVTFGTSSTGTYAASASGYPGTSWTANGSGDGSTALNKTNCDAAGTSLWAWFADANGDGDTTDPEDGECVQTASSTGSWNGAILAAGTSLTTQTSTSVSTSTITKTGAGWTVDNYKNDSVKITNGSANACWGIIKTNTSDTITIYGSWLAADHTACASMPTGTPTFTVNLENYQDNTWIGDYTCTGNFPTGTVVWHNYPTVTQAGVSNVALASADCYDGKRDLLPNETDRAVLSGTITSLATTSTTTTITDSSLTASPVSANDFIGQEVLITGGTGINSTSTIEWNTASSFTVNTWSSTTPDVGSIYKVIYIIPFAGSTAGTSNLKYKGPLTIEVLKAWKGTRLPTSMDFWGYCGAKTGDAYNSVGDGLYHASGASDKTAIGLSGVNAGRGKNVATGNDNYLYMSNYGSYEWLSEQYNNISARVAGNNACSSVSGSNVNSSLRFRAFFRP